MDNVNSIKQLWFAECIQAYIDRTTEELDETDKKSYKLYYDSIKQSDHFIRIQYPTNGDEPLRITLIDNESCSYNDQHGRILVHAPRITTMSRKGKDFSFEHESDMHTVIDYDIAEIRSCNKKDSLMLYKMFHSIEKSVQDGLNWLLK